MNNNGRQSYQKLRTLYEQKYLKETSFTDDRSYNNPIKYRNVSDVKKKLNQFGVFTQNTTKKTIKIVFNAETIKTEDNLNTVKLSSSSKRIQQKMLDFQLQYEYLSSFKKQKYSIDSCRIDHAYRCSTSQGRKKIQSTTKNRTLTSSQTHRDSNNLTMSMGNAKHSLIEMLKQNQSMRKSMRKEDKYKHIFHVYNDDCYQSRINSGRKYVSQRNSPVKYQFSTKLRTKNSHQQYYKQYYQPLCLKPQTLSAKDSIDPWIVTEPDF